MSNSKKQSESAKARKQEIVEEFIAFCQERDLSGDWAKYVSRTGDKLNRTEIANELTFSRSVWGSNAELAEKLREQEEKLRERAVLSLITEKDTKSIKAESDRKDRSLGQSQSRVKSLEQQLAAVTAERDDLRRRVERLEFLEHHMTNSGRVPY